ncbi:MAG: L,D-transpeptidase family protein [Candidatus Omnitrophota bacterium]
MKRPFTIVLVGVGIICLTMTVVFIAAKSKNTNRDSQNPYTKEADMAFLNNDFLEAQKLYKQAQSNTDDVAKLKDIQKKLEDVNIKIIFSPIMDKCSVKYTVKPNDSLGKIAKEYNTTIELIKRANNLSRDVIRPGDKFKVNNCKFAIVVDKSQNLLFLKNGDDIIKTYVISTGKNNSTPVGTFKIVNKQTNPTWFKAGAVVPPDSPENILGTRWMGFDLKSYGIHGTTDPDALGKQITAGCVRMRNSEVEELYDIVPVGTEVTIVD